MPPANISFGKRSKRRFILPAIIVVLLGAGALAYIGRGTSSTKKAEEKTPQVAFTVAAFQPVSEGKAVAPAVSDAEKTAILTLLTEYYQTAFVDPKGWTDPAWPAITARFSPGAKASFTKDVNALTIGAGRTDFRRVEPTLADLKLSVYFDAKGQPTFAVAAVTFRANATTKDRKKVNVVQDATYRLEKGTAGWSIFSYTASAKQDTPAPSPSGSPST